MLGCHTSCHVVQFPFVPLLVMFTLTLWLRGSLPGFSVVK